MLYLGALKNYWVEFKGLKPSDPLTKDFLGVIDEIEAAIYTQKLEGAADGLFNSNIIARELGLTEKTENTHKNLNHNSVEISPEQIREISKALEDDF